MSDGSDFDVEGELDLTPPPVGSQYHPPETEEVLLQLRDVIDAARPVPLSASSMISKEEVLELIDEAIARLPEELRAARWLLKEREEYLARVRHEGGEILEQARARAERMVQRTEVVKAADQAYQIVETVESERVGQLEVELLRPEPAISRSCRRTITWAAGAPRGRQPAGRERR